MKIVGVGGVRGRENHHLHSAGKRETALK